MKWCQEYEKTVQKSNSGYFKPWLCVNDEIVHYYDMEHYYDV